MQKATIKIDPDRVLGKIDRRMYGGLLEHLGRCIYGGIYEPNSPLSDAHGLRADVIEAIKELGITILRWPGGNFVSGYHWQDGIGPQEDRPRKMDLAWFAEEPNTFGTHEFIDFCRQVNAEPYICINMGTGTIDEAQAWVEYCNGTGNTYWANLRRKNGAENPFQVKLWALGNEIHGHWQIGKKTVDEYCRMAVEYAKVMKWTDPSIQLVSCGKDGLNDWDLQVLESLAPYVDYHCVHMYSGNPNYYANVFAPHQAERAIHVLQGITEKVRHQQPNRKPIRIAYDEWNVWYRALDNSLEEVYDLSDSLAVATYLNIFQRNCALVGLANYAQMVNVIAPIVTNATGLFQQTVYFPLMLYALHSQALAINTYLECDGYQLSKEEETASPRPHRVWDLGPFPWLDVSATRSEDGREITLAVVNRSPYQEIETMIYTTHGDWSGEGVAYTVNGPDIRSINSFEQPNTVGVTVKPIPSDTQYARIMAFPPHSITLCKWKLV